MSLKQSSCKSFELYVGICFQLHFIYSCYLCWSVWLYLSVCVGLSVCAIVCLSVWLCLSLCFGVSVCVVLSACLCGCKCKSPQFLRTTQNLHQGDQIPANQVVWSILVPGQNQGVRSRRHQGAMVEIIGDGSIM